jgi:peptidoglycan/xylan/chitin deacetylase (PgdA/CDA1 family)
MRTPIATLTIFTFHRLVEREDPLFPEYHTANEFSEIVRVLSKFFELDTLSNALTKLDHRQNKQPLGVITFDDGYVDNFEIALPILKHLNVKATFFVSTAFLNGGVMFSDYVAEAFRGYTGEAILEKFGMANAKITNWEDRIRLHREISQRFKYKPQAQRDSLAQQFFVAMSSSKQLDSQMMTSVQVNELAKQKMEIGSHTHQHIIFTQASTDEAQIDIAKSKSILEDITQSTINGFAFPNGKSSSDFTAGSIAIVKEAQFNYAVTTDPGLYIEPTSRFLLPRVSVWHKSQIKFAWMLRKHRLLSRLNKLVQG